MVPVARVRKKDEQLFKKKTRVAILREGYLDHYDVYVGSSW